MAKHQNIHVPNNRYMMHEQIKSNPVILFLLNVIAIIVSYYVAILLHEWGHGTVAWMYGIKSSPFDIQYGGWLLQNADENVNYATLLNSNHGITAAMIGIAGPVVSFILAIFSFILLNRKSYQHNNVKFIFIYWFLMINMIPLVQYFTVSAFSSEGDTGRFVHGLNISALWIFIPGTVFIIYALWRILTKEIIRAYIVMPINSIFGRNILLLATLSVIFLFIYSHGYNPLTDKGINTISRILAITSISFVPLLFIVCNPLLSWVKKATDCKI